METQMSLLAAGIDGMTTHLRDEVRSGHRRHDHAPLRDEVRGGHRRHDHAPHRDEVKGRASTA
jgi:hypothetical protein